MNRIKCILSACVILSISTSAFAAKSVTSDEGLTEIGVVSVRSASTLDDLENKVADKANKAGASAYRIISAHGDNRLHGVAVIYR
ncbi:YdgH/BhsA/McbA-like domain containing protein [Pectobacterium brasiliense]|uniref:multiple stress resistance protein BhsA n=1 Tax=Pectobacterium brasiliense TaxID=180957 RepID=UPI003019C38B